VDVGEDDDAEVWVVTRTLCYRWCQGENGRWAYRLKSIWKPEEGDWGTGMVHSGGDDG
jgi:hypothetical protein